MNLNLNFEFWPVGYRPKLEPVRTDLTGNWSNRTGSHRFDEPWAEEARVSDGVAVICGRGAAASSAERVARGTHGVSAGPQGSFGGRGDGEEPRARSWNPDEFVEYDLVCCGASAEKGWFRIARKRAPSPNFTWRALVSQTQLKSVPRGWVELKCGHEKGLAFSHALALLNREREKETLLLLQLTGEPCLVMRVLPYLLLLYMSRD